jgi:choline transport protein
VSQVLIRLERYPISGGQYHWVALLAPPRYAKFLSWLTGMTIEIPRGILPSDSSQGWVSTLGWQAAAATGTYLGGTIIQGLLVLNDSTYVPQRWHATLILYAVLFLTLLANTILVKFLPSLEGLILILHVVGFFAILIPVVHLAPISSASFVFTDFTNLSGYSSSGASWFIGQSASAILFIGYDGACHMGEF